MIRRIAISLLSITLVACLVLVMIILLGTVIILGDVSSYQVTPTSFPNPTREVISTPAEEDLPFAVVQSMDEIEDQVSQITGLSQNQAVHRSLLSSSELRRHVENDFFTDYPPDEILVDSAVYNKLGLLPPDYDLKKLLVDLYSEQVSGYYDPKTGEMFVVKGAGFDGVEQMTYAHEFTHALQDQTYDLRQGLNLRQELCEQETEYCTAVTALVEGDALLTEQIWFSRYATPQDRADVQDFALSFQSPILDSAPLFIQEDLLFPYRQGLEFAASLYDNGGRTAINKAFLSPPVSSEQILHPGLYPLVSAEEIGLPDAGAVLGGSWELIDRDSLGEWAVSLVLSSGWQEDFRLPQRTAKQAASGWAGGAYQYFRDRLNGDEIFLVQVNFDNTAEAEEFWLAFSSYGQKRWGNLSAMEDARQAVWTNTPEGDITCIIDETRLIWMIAPSKDLFQRILSIMPGFTP